MQESALQTIQRNSVIHIEQLNDTAADHYIYQTRSFINWLKSNNQDVTEDSIRSYFTWLNEESGYRAQTIALKRQAVKKRVKQLFKDAPINDRMKIDKVLSELDHESKTKAPKVNTQQVSRDMIINTEDYPMLLNACRTDRQRLFIEFMYSTGCRVTEMINIKLTDCQDLGKAIKIRLLGKGRKERFIKIQKDLYNRIREHYNGSTYLFETSSGEHYNRSYISGQIKKIGKLINRNISAHTLRHSWATRMVNLYPGKIDAISKYLGHSTPAITLAMYCHSELTDDELFLDFVA